MRNNDPIRSQFCTCHDSSAVVACPKLWTDWITRIRIRAKRIFNDELSNHMWNGSLALICSMHSHPVLLASLCISMHDYAYRAWTCSCGCMPDIYTWWICMQWNGQRGNFHTMPTHIFCRRFVLCLDKAIGRVNICVENNPWILLHSISCCIWAHTLCLHTHKMQIFNSICKKNWGIFVIFSW